MRKSTRGEPSASSTPRSLRHEITDQPSFAEALILPGQRAKASRADLAGDQDLFVASSTTTAADFLEARIRASSLVSTAVAVTPSGETVTTKYGIPGFGG
jgi:hypothetical protein